MVNGTVSSVQYGFAATIYTFGALSTVWLTYRYIKRPHSSESNQPLYYMTLLFFTFIVLTFITYGIHALLYVIAETDVRTVATIGNFTYVCQYGMLFGILWCRICIVFQGFAGVSTNTQRVFWIAYISDALFALIQAVIVRNSELFYTYWAVLIPIICVILTICVIVMLIGAFIYRIAITFKNVQNDDVLSDHDAIAADAMSVVTKTFIMTVSSIITLFLVGVMQIIESVTPFNIYFQFVMNITLATDLAINFLSVLLLFKCFEHYYLFLCGKCHRKCGIYCTKTARDDARSARPSKNENTEPQIVAV
eukprot:250821_1